MYKNTTT